MDPQREFFNQRAADWEKRLYPPKVRQRLEKLIQAFDVQSGSWVLDVGTGTGVLFPYLQAAVQSRGRILAFDISDNMVLEAAKKGRTGRALFFQADALHIPVHEDAMDHVICFAAFPHFSDMAAGLCEMTRVLKPDGRLTIAHLMSRQELAAHHARHNAVERDVLPKAGRMTDWFLAAGLKEPEITDIPGRYMATARKG